ncbi:MAG: sigma-70 family RNA polymerase sigma factor [Planctomycetota bacterium]
MKYKPEALLAHADFLRSLARSLILDAHRADDVVQDTWVAALENPPQGSGSPRGWLAAVIRNFARKVRRGETRRLMREQRAAKPASMDSTARIVEWESMRRRVVKAVLSLDEIYRSVIVLRYYDDLAPRKIAERLGLPMETAKTRLKRGLAHLRAELNAEFGGDGTSWCAALAPMAGIKLATTSAAVATASVSWTSLLTGVTAMGMKMKWGVAGVLLILGLSAGTLFLLNMKERTQTDSALETISSIEINDSNGSTQETSTGKNNESGSFEDPGRQPRVNMAPLEEDMLTIFGRVLDEEGKPLEGAVVLESTSSRTDPWKDQLIWTSTGVSTAKDGSFRIMVARFKRGRLFLNIEMACYEYSEVLPIREAVPRKDGVLSLGDIQIFPARSIAGTVIDEQGRPVPGCLVSALGRPWERGTRSAVKTDSEGRFHQTCPNKNWGFLHHVWAYMEGFGVGWAHCPAPGTNEKVPEVTIILETGRDIAGMILTAGGEPAEGLHVIADLKKNGIYYTLREHTDSEGSFRFSPTPEGQYRLLAHLPGMRSKEHNEFMTLADEIPAGSEDLRFHLPATGGVILELFDPGGNPVEMQPSVVTFQPSKDHSENDDRKEGIWIRWDWYGSAQILGAGRFGYPFVKEGIYDIRVFHSNRYLEHVFKGISITAEDSPVLLQTTLKNMHLIEGKLFHEDGSPVPGVKVLCSRSLAYPDSGSPKVWFSEAGLRMQSDRYNRKEAVTDAEGHFRFICGVKRNYPRNEYHLHLDLDGREILVAYSISLSDDHPQEHVEIILPDTKAFTGSIEGFLQDSNGKTLPDALVIAWDAGENFYRTRADENGKYLFTHIPDGRYIVDARAIPSPSTMFRTPSFERYLREGYKDLESVNPYNAVVENGKNCRLDLKISDPWNASLSGKLTWTSPEMPSQIEVELIPVNDKGSRCRHWPPEELQPKAGDLFCYPFQDLQDLDPRRERYLFKGLAAGRYLVYVKGYVPSNRGFPELRHLIGKFLDLSPSEKRQITLPLSQASIQGMVKDKKTSLGIAGADVVFRIQDSWAIDPKLGIYETTGQDGSFMADLVPAGTYDVYIAHDGYAHFRKTDFHIHDNDEKHYLSFLLEPACTLEGWIEFLTPPPEVIDVSLHIGVPKWGGKERWSGAKIGDDGTFRLEQLPPGAVKLIVKVRGKPVLEKTITLPLKEGKKVILEVPPIFELPSNDEQKIF